MRTSIRLFLVLNAAALAALAAAAVVAVGLPLVASRTPSAVAVAAMALAAGALVLVAGSALLVRGVARPLDRLAAAAARLGSDGSAPGALPILGDAGLAPSRAAVAFERLALALAEERSRLAAKVEELTRANRALADARESLVRSEKLATVGRLASGLAHEVGNPLGAVAGYVELARARLPPAPHPDLVDALARIAAAADRIDRTVRGLLDFARPAPLALVPVDVAAAVDATVRLARVQPRFRGVEVALDVTPGLRVVADEHHLAQVLLNLLLNAGDAMGGCGKVRVAARADRTPPGRVVLEIADEGPGIATEDLPRIFDPFFTTKEPGQGTGLGLAISHRLMEAFGGDIAARNAPGGGAVFELRLRAAT